jgi:hypothetical protein
MSKPLTLTGWLLITWLIWGPIIINSQPGTQFFVFGIDWKADNLDNTMFWIGILFLIAIAFAETYREKQEDKRREKYGSYQERNI